jgi:hypothetical protein
MDTKTKILLEANIFMKLKLMNEIYILVFHFLTAKNWRDWKEEKEYFFLIALIKELCSPRIPSMGKTSES